MIKKNLDDNTIENTNDILKDDDSFDDSIDVINDTNKINIEYYKDKVLKKKLENEKTMFIKHIQRKIDGIEQRMRYINHKYVDYLSYYKCLNGMVIILSSLLTLFEASRQIISYEIIENDTDSSESYFTSDNTVLKLFFQFMPLILSTLVSLLATYIKFQKYQEKMEGLIVTEEKGVIAISKLKKIREQTYFEKENIEAIKQAYLEETYQLYNEVNIKISIELDEADYKRYYKKMSKVDINIGNTYLKKTRDINDIIDQHTNMEKEYKDNKINYRDNTESEESESSDSENSNYIETRPVKETERERRNSVSCTGRT